MGNHINRMEKMDFEILAPYQPQQFVPDSANLKSGFSGKTIRPLVRILLDEWQKEL